MINFLHPSFLFALFSISVPIVIHLFHFRKFRKVWFSNVSFLQQIKTEKQSKNKLKHLLILFLRILAISCLVFAFSQPFIKNKNISLKSGNNSISIYIDNSFSMENQASDNSLFEEARKIAGEIVRGSGNNDQFQVLTNELKIKQQRFYTQKDIGQLINEAEISPFSRDMKLILLSQSASLSKENTANKIAYILSDFQKTTANLEKIKADKSITTILIPIKAQETSNMLIDSAWFESPVIRLNQPAELTVRIRNLSDRATEESNIRLNINGKEKALNTFSLAAGQSSDLKISFTVSNPGWNNCKLFIDDYPVTFDNDFYFSFYVDPGSRILCINGNLSNNFIRTVYNTDNYFSFSESDINGLNYASFRNYQLIILNEAEKISSGLLTWLENYVSEGGNLLFIPTSADKFDLSLYKPFFERFEIPEFNGIYLKELKVTGVNNSHPLLKNVFEKKVENVNYPTVKKSYSRLSGNYSSETSVLSLENEQSLLTVKTSGKGNIFILSVPLNTSWTNFPRHGLFVPVMFQMALFQSHGAPLCWYIGDSHPIEPVSHDSTELSSFKLYNNEHFFIPDNKKINGRIQIYQDENFKQAGFYYMVPENLQKFDKRMLSPYTVFAMNYDRRESEMKFYSARELKNIAGENGFNLLAEKTKNIRYLVQNMDHGKPLWKFFIWLALLFLLSEILILRFWKV